MESLNDSDDIWNFECPQFVDFCQKEMFDNDDHVDSFFAKEEESRRSTFEVPKTPAKNADVSEKKLTPKRRSSAQEANSLCYETPDKENAVDDDVFYSLKKSTSKPSYHLRLTPMRLLQAEGLTPMKEPRSTHSKRKKKKKAADKSHNETFDMVEIEEALQEITEQEEQVETVVEEHEEEEEEKENVEVEQVESPKIVSIPEEEEELMSSDGEHQENEVGHDSIVSNLFKIKKFEEEAAETPKNRLSFIIASPALQSNQKLAKRLSKAKDSLSKARSNMKRTSKKTPLIKTVKFVRTKLTPTPRPKLSFKPLSGSNKKQTASTGKRYLNFLKAKDTPKVEKFKSMAELIREFETKTRVYERPSRSLDRSSSGQRSRSSSLTRPVSPKLQVIHRNRTHSVLSREQQEEIVARQIRMCTFKARPVNKKIFEDAKYAGGIPKVKSMKEPTKPQDMKFMTDQRLAIRRTKSESQNEEICKPEFHANPMPVFKTPATRSKSASKPTLFKPFSFDDREKERWQKKQQLFKEQLERNANSGFVFRAKPAPVYKTGPLKTVN